jgi:hypothetical protein
LNKRDIFRAKVRKIKLSDHLGMNERLYANINLYDVLDDSSEDTIDALENTLASKFGSADHSPPVQTYITCATDSSMVMAVFAGIIKSVRQESIKRSGQ